jgi:hypothetical protein
MLLLLYVSLDFTNPLMPGAVRFVDGAVDAVSADRARDGDPGPQPALAVCPVPLDPAPPGPVERIRPLATRRDRPPVAPGRQARVFASDPPPAASPDH